MVHFPSQEVVPMRVCMIFINMFDVIHVNVYEMHMYDRINIFDVFPCQQGFQSYVCVICVNMYEAYI